MQRQTLVTAAAAAAAAAAATELRPVNEKSVAFKSLFERRCYANPIADYLHGDSFVSAHGIERFACACFTL
jgi:hypothetical protein